MLRLRVVRFLLYILLLCISSRLLCFLLLFRGLLLDRVENVLYLLDLQRLREPDDLEGVADDRIVAVAHTRSRSVSCQVFYRRRAMLLCPLKFLDARLLQIQLVVIVVTVQHVRDTIMTHYTMGSDLIEIEFYGFHFMVGLEFQLKQLRRPHVGEVEVGRRGLLSGGNL